jgi:hypothetical protein
VAHKGAADSDCRNTPFKLRSPGSESKASEDSDCRNPPLKLRSPGSESSGRGFYNPGNGKITPTFQTVLAECHFKAFWGDDASVQPGHLQEIMLHETAVSWLRHRLTTTVPTKAWEETPLAFATRLRQCCAEINSTLDVDGLCRDFPNRIQKLVDKKGGRLAE